MKIQIRNVEIQDFEPIYEFSNELEEEEFDKPKQRKIFLENLSNEKNIYLVATEDTTVIGYLSCHVQKLLHYGGEVGEIQEMFVVSKKEG